jgi:hypothetical protein
VKEVSHHLQDAYVPSAAFEGTDIVIIMTPLCLPRSTRIHWLLLLSVRSTVVHLAWFGRPSVTTVVGTRVWWIAF